MAQERQNQTPRTTWQHYTKAGAIFFATTATYLLVRTTGALDSLWHWNEGDGAANDQAGETLQSAVARVVEPVGTEVATIATQGEHRMNLDLVVTPVATTQTSPNVNVVDWSERELPAADLRAPAIVDALSRNSDELEAEITEIQSTATARRLLQTGSGVTVANPIPDQVIEATALYTYNISNVFAGNYTLMGVTLANGSDLPTWLNAQFISLGSYDTPGSAQGVQVLDTIAYVADGFSGLQVLNVSNLHNITQLGSYNTPGSATNVRIQDGVAYVADGSSGLQVLNVSNPANITYLATYYIPGLAYGVLNVEVQNSLAYVAFSSSLQILNISNPTQPAYVGSYNTTDYINSVHVQNGIAYMANNDLGIQVLNVSNPRNVSRLGSYVMSYAFDVEVENSLAYVVNSLGLQVLNVSNPSNITSLGSYALQYVIYDLQMLNGIAYLANRDGGLQVLNAKNPRAITRLGSYDTPGLAQGVQVQAGVAYVADITSGLQAIDLRQGRLFGTPTAARTGESYAIRLSAYDENSLIAAYDDFQLTIARLPHRVDTSLVDRSVLPSQTLSITLDSDVLFTDPSGSTLTLSMQVSALTATSQLTSSVLQLKPIFTGSYGTLNFVQYQYVQLQNGLAYVVDYAGGLQVLDVRNPSAITFQGLYNTPGLAQSAQIQNGVAYVADGCYADGSFGGLRVLNVSSPQNITLLSNYNTPGSSVYAVQMHNGVAYVAAGSSGLQVLNVTNPRNISYLGSYNISSDARGVQVQNGVAYVIDVKSLGLLQVLNVSNPLNITYLGSCYIPGTPQGIQVLGDVAYVESGSSGFFIVNISNPYTVHPIGSTSIVASNAHILGSVAYVTGGYSGLQVLNISNPRNISQLGGYGTPDNADSYANSVQVQNGLAYIAGGSSGLQILDLTQWEFRVTPTFAEVGNYRVTVTATNELGGTSSDSFELRVEGGPQLNPNITIPQLFAKVGVPFNYFIPQGLLSDPNNDPISFTARSADNSSLPGWLSFNGISATFSGLAQDNNVGNYSLRIIATDNVPGTLNAETVFSLYVDHLPYVNQHIADQVAGVGLPYNFTVPSSTIIDPDNGDILSYSTYQRGGSALPSWLNFNTTSRRFFGTPTVSDAGSYGLVLSASDNHQGEASTEFNLLVDHFPAANLNQSLVVPVAGVGQTWAMTLPPSAFIDADDMH